MVDMAKYYPYTAEAKFSSLDAQTRDGLCQWMYENVGIRDKDWQIGDYFKVYDDESASIRIYLKHKKDVVLTALRWS